MWVFPNIGVPQNGWFIMENPMKMDDLGIPDTPIFQNTHVYNSHVTMLGFDSMNLHTGSQPPPHTIHFWASMMGSVDRWGMPFRSLISAASHGNWPMLQRLLEKGRTNLLKTLNIRNFAGDPCGSM